MIREKVLKIRAAVGDGSDESKEIALVHRGTVWGSGTFGIVHKAKLQETGEVVAVKSTITTSSRASLEVKHLKELKHCNIINMLYHFRKRRGDAMYEYIVMESMPTTLYDFYYNRDITFPRKMLQRYRTPSGKRKISVFEIKLYMYQLLRALAYMHAKDICHRDVRPENILIDSSTGVLKLCDFGLTKDLTRSQYNSTHVCALWYRAPEMLLGFTNYTKAIDLWSAGCILVELLNGGTELFSDTEYPEQHLKELIQVFGTPTEDQFPGMIPECDFDTLPNTEPLPWSKILLTNPIPDDAISLCSGLLCYSPSSRLLPQEALAHKFFDELRSPETTHLANGNPLPPLFNFQPEEFPGDMKQLIPPLTGRGESCSIFFNWMCSFMC